MVDKDAPFELFLYGLIVTVFTILGHKLDVEIASAVLGGAAAAGLLLCVLAVLWMRGYRVQRWAFIVLLLLSVLLLIQALLSWLVLMRDPSAKVTPIIVTMLLIFALGQLATVFRSGGKMQSSSEGETRTTDTDARTQDRSTG
jgi:hypothetical protein